MSGISYSCHSCDYVTENRTKFVRHLGSTKHDISTKGIHCCGLKYFDKHQWVNHKKSIKHQHHKKDKK